MKKNPHTENSRKSGSVMGELKNIAPGSSRAMNAAALERLFPSTGSRVRYVMPEASAVAIVFMSVAER